jgi:leucyl/phenylalanyl-tRNA---protein transferase
MHSIALEPGTLLSAYAQGAFPMTDRDGATRWYTADPRGVIPLEDFHVPKSLAQIIRQKQFEIRINFDFETVMRACMNARPEGSWISQQLIDAYVALHKLGHAHSVEAWRNNELAGGLYGVTLGAAFFGESMFHRQRDASKVALCALVDRLRERRFELLDAQAQTAHLERFGCIEVSSRDYLFRLKRALSKETSFL